VNIKISAFLLFLLSACGQGGADSIPVEKLTLNENDIDAISIILSEDPTNDSVEILANIGGITKNANACAKILAVQEYFTDNYQEWANQNNVNWSKKLRVNLVDILSYDEYDEVKDTKIYGVVSVNGNDVKIQLADGIGC